jgi:hypothetical protein
VVRAFQQTVVGNPALREGSKAVRAFVFKDPPGGGCLVPPDNKVSAEQCEGHRLRLIEVFDVMERIPRLLTVEPRRVGTTSGKFINLTR